MSSGRCSASWRSTEAMVLSMKVPFQLHSTTSSPESQSGKALNLLSCAKAYQILWTSLLQLQCSLLCYSSKELLTTCKSNQTKVVNNTPESIQSNYCMPHPLHWWLSNKSHPQSTCSLKLCGRRLVPTSSPSLLVPITNLIKDQVKCSQLEDLLGSSLHHTLSVVRSSTQYTPSCTPLWPSPCLPSFPSCGWASLVNPQKNNSDN